MNDYILPHSPLNIIKAWAQHYWVAGVPNERQRDYD